MKALKITLLTLLGLVVVSVAAAAIFVATFDANRYKPEIEQLVLEKTGRTLKIDGDIHLTLWPNIGAELGRTALSDKDPNQAFVTLESTEVSVAVMPLLSGQVLIDGIAIDGLSANITRDTGGVFNFDDLLGQAGAATPPKTSEAARDDVTESTTENTTQAASFQFDIGSIALTDASISYTDLQNNADLNVSSLNVTTGQIAAQSSGRLELSAKAQSESMALDTTLALNGDYKLDLPAQQIDLGKLETKLTGRYQDIESIDSAFTLNLAAHTGTDTYVLSNVDGKLKAEHAGQVANLIIKTAQVNVTGTEITTAPSELALSLKALSPQSQGRVIDTSLTLPGFTLANNQLDSKDLSANVSVTDPALGKEPLKLTASGDLWANTQSETIKTNLAGQFDGSPVKLDAGVTGFKTPAITFDIALDQFKLDRFMAAKQATDQTDRKDQAGTLPQATATAAPIDLSALKGHNIKGQLRVGKLLSRGLAIDDLQADVALVKGKLSVAPHRAQLFGGKLAGSLTVDANTNQFTLKENITGVKLDDLLKALGQEPKVTGQGALVLDLSTTGTNVKSLEQNLAGTANVNLKDGTIKGIDVGAIINNVRGMLGKAPTEQGAASGQTTFTELTATATLKNGIATNRDLNLKAPLFRLEGAGTANIPTASLDYLAKVAVVETSSGQGGADLAALRGVTIPIKITGTFNDPRYRVDVASLASELAKSKLGDRARDEINKVAPGLGDALKGLFGR